MKIYICAFLLLTYSSTSFSKNIEIYEKCQLFFEKDYSNIIKKEVKNHLYINEYDLLDRVRIKISSDNTSSLAYIDNDNIFFNKNIFSLLCKRQLDLMAFSEVSRNINSQYDDFKKITQLGSGFFSNLTRYWTVCLAINLDNKLCKNDRNYSASSGS